MIPIPKMLLNREIGRSNNFPKIMYNNLKSLYITSAPIERLNNVMKYLIMSGHMKILFTDIDKNTLLEPDAYVCCGPYNAIKLYVHNLIEDKYILIDDYIEMVKLGYNSYALVADVIENNSNKYKYIKISGNEIDIDDQQFDQDFYDELFAGLKTRSYNIFFIVIICLMVSLLKFI